MKMTKTIPTMMTVLSSSPASLGGMVGRGVIAEGVVVVIVTPACSSVEETGKRNTDINVNANNEVGIILYLYIPI